MQDSSLASPKLSLLAAHHGEWMLSCRSGESDCADRSTPGPRTVPSKAWRECEPASRTHILTALHPELLEDYARRGGGDGAEQQPHEQKQQKRCQGFSQQRANMSQQPVPLPSTLMGSSAALIEGKCLGQAKGVLPRSDQTTPEGRAGPGCSEEREAAPSQAAPGFLMTSSSGCLSGLQGEPGIPLQAGLVQQAHARLHGIEGFLKTPFGSHLIEGWGTTAKVKNREACWGGQPASRQGGFEALSEDC